ncbi:hypothetical protein Tco_0488313 [Tanacetum coccineum]
MHNQFSQILATLENIKTLTPEPTTPTLAITTRSRTTTRDPLYPSPPSSSPADNARTTIERENPNDGETPTTWGHEDLQSPTLYHPSKSSSIPFPSRLKKQKKKDEDDGHVMMHACLFRTALTALIAFMPTSPNGALGSLDYKKEERRILAVKSRESAPKFGTPDRQKLIDEIHEYMISKAPPVPQKTSEDKSGETPTPVASEVVADEAPGDPQYVNTEIIENAEQHLEGNHEAAANEDTEPEGPRVSRRVATIVPSAASSVHTVQAQQEQVLGVQKPADDRLFTWAAVGLTIAIVVLILKKFMKASGHGAVFIDES